ncbi:hypothetical protein Adt_17984 [Abeliophyllum distichum]|uniref:Uncharacterized protein n=1 Tax=Abeliophyllum distichum TaxID=126358 RepID=A0ABD1TI23_9LAMI
MRLDNCILRGISPNCQIQLPKAVPRPRRQKFGAAPAVLPNVDCETEKRLSDFSDCGVPQRRGLLFKLQTCFRLPFSKALFQLPFSFRRVSSFPSPTGDWKSGSQASLFRLGFLLFSILF